MSGTFNSAHFPCLFNVILHLIAMPSPHTPHPTPQTPALLLFDLGGVLVRICHGWKKVCEHHGYTPPAILDDPQAIAALIEICRLFETGQRDENYFITESAKLTGFTHEQVRTALHHWVIEPYEGAHELIDRVTQIPGLMTACLSNTNATHWEMMQGLNGHTRTAVPLHRLTHRFASHLIGAMKPEPAIYEHVEKTLNIEPGSILFFDDHPPNVIAARQRGWQVEQIDPTGNSPAQIVSHLKARKLL